MRMQLGTRQNISMSSLRSGETQKRHLNVCVYGALWGKTKERGKGIPKWPASEGMSACACDLIEGLREGLSEQVVLEQRPEEPEEWAVPTSGAGEGDTHNG